MLSFSGTTRVYLAKDPVDLRRGHDGLCALVRSLYACDLYDGTIFAFVGRGGNRIKLLYWEHGGFVVVYKRLETGRFRLPAIPSSATSITLDPASLRMLLDGIDLASVRRIPVWRPAKVA